jgi:hypothetical protein
MQLVSSKKLKALTVSSALAFTPTIFSYNDFNDNSIVNAITLNPQTQKYLQESNENTYLGIILKNNFEKYLVQWKKNTQFYSISNQIVQDVYFQKIISMGESAVPLILNEIKNKPSTLVWALNIIYQKKITDKQNATIEEACKLWVKTLN